jgi:hypothetical protein
LRKLEINYSNRKGGQKLESVAMPQYIFQTITFTQKINLPPRATVVKAKSAFLNKCDRHPEVVSFF